MKFRYGDQNEMRTAVNIKFGILNERAAFADKLHETIQKAHDSGRRYKRDADRPLAVFQVGQSDLLRLPEVEGGAGLPEHVLTDPPAPKRLPKRQKKEADLHRNDSDSEDSSSDSDSETEADQNANQSLGNPGGVRTEKKQQNARIAKAIFGINVSEPVWMKRCYLNRTVPFRGHIILSEKYLCFWRKSAGPVPDIKVSRSPAAPVNSYADQIAKNRSVSIPSSRHQGSRTDRRLQIQVPRHVGQGIWASRFAFRLFQPQSSSQGEFRLRTVH
jgi:hypothetical protein